ncbi:Amino acid permease family protein [Aspergillus niger]|uniref:Amino acid permease family protein n=1 Tax=Aspergillus niger TaxID=5061 RepID=A0A505IMW4_ASPNG|nr:Amino acid permease family protein [Aspergillus niger]
MAVAALDQLRSLFSGTTGSILKSKELLADQNIAQPMSGNTRNKIYTWLEEQGLSATGSREPQVETRWISFGDDGSLINANSKGSSDLHCALESSGSDFGIVTLFDLEPHLLIKIQ